MSLRICRHVVDPMPMWRRYAQNYACTIREYDLSDPGDPNALTDEEAWRSRIINSRLTYAERDEVVRRAASAPWDCVPVGADLIEADPCVPDGLFADMARLYWFFTWPQPISGVRVAKVHKILHPKRPALYPILDQRIKALYSPCAAAWTERLGYLDGITASDSPPYWAAFRDDLVRNRDFLEECRARLAEEESGTVRSMAKLTCLRLQDIIAWMIAADA